MRDQILEKTGVSCLFNLGDKEIVPSVNTAGMFYTCRGNNIKFVGYIFNSHAHIHLLTQTIEDLRNASDYGSSDSKRLIKFLTDELNTAMAHAGEVSRALRS